MSAKHSAEKTSDPATRARVERFLRYAGSVAHEKCYSLEEDPEHPGAYLVRDVPIFVEHTRGDVTFTRENLEAIVRHHEGLEQTRHRVPIFAGHHAYDDEEDRPKVGNLRNLRMGEVEIVHPDTHEVCKLPAIFADLGRIKPRYAARMLEGDLEYRSVEVYPGTPRISGLALTSTIPPYFKFENMVCVLAEGAPAPTRGGEDGQEFAAFTALAARNEDRLVLCYAERMRVEGKMGEKHDAHRRYVREAVSGQAEGLIRRYLGLVGFPKTETPISMGDVLDHLWRAGVTGLDLPDLVQRVAKDMGGEIGRDLFHSDDLRGRSRRYAEKDRINEFARELGVDLSWFGPIATIEAMDRDHADEISDAARAAGLKPSNPFFDDARNTWSVEIDIRYLFRERGQKRPQGQSHRARCYEEDSPGWLFGMQKVRELLDVVGDPEGLLSRNREKLEMLVKDDSEAKFQLRSAGIGPTSENLAAFQRAISDALRFRFRERSPTAAPVRSRYSGRELAHEWVERDRVRRYISRRELVQGGIFRPGASSARARADVMTALRRLGGRAEVSALEDAAAAVSGVGGQEAANAIADLLFDGVIIAPGDGEFVAWAREPLIAASERRTAMTRRKFAEARMLSRDDVAMVLEYLGFADALKKADEVVGDAGSASVSQVAEALGLQLAAVADAVEYGLNPEHEGTAMMMRESGRGHRERGRGPKRALRYGLVDEMFQILRERGHVVEAPVTGSVIVDGEEILPNEWDRIERLWDGTDDDLEDLIREARPGEEYGLTFSDRRPSRRYQAAAEEPAAEEPKADLEKSLLERIEILKTTLAELEKLAGKVEEEEEEPEAEEEPKAEEKKSEPPGEEPESPMAASEPAAGRRSFAEDALRKELDEVKERLAVDQERRALSEVAERLRRGGYAFVEADLPEIFAGSLGDEKAREKRFKAYVRTLSKAPQGWDGVEEDGEEDGVLAAYAHNPPAREKAAQVLAAYRQDGWLQKQVPLETILRRKVPGGRWPTPNGNGKHGK